MINRKIARRFGRPARDVLTGLALFTLVCLSSVADRGAPTSLFAGSAHARFLEMQPADGLDQVVYGEAPSTPPHRQAAAMITLALAFSTLFATNLWFYRHLRRVSASRRRT